MIIGNQGSDRPPYRWFAKLFCTWDNRTKLLRLGRLVWARGKPGTSAGWSAKLSLALTPKLLYWSRKKGWEWQLIVLGVRLHYVRSYGGWIT